jgi:serine/threonine protein kinase
MKIYAYQLFRGLNYLVMLQIAHRDIKPQNILVDRIKHKLIISDFGSAKQLIPSTFLPIQPRPIWPISAQDATAHPNSSLERPTTPPRSICGPPDAFWSKWSMDPRPSWEILKSISSNKSSRYWELPASRK